MNVRAILNIKSLNTKKEKSLSLLKEEEDMTISKRDLEVRRNQSLRRRLRSLRRSLLSLNVLNANNRDYYVSEELNLSSLMRKRKHNNKKFNIYFFKYFL